MKISNKEKAVALLNSFNTGDKAPISYINPKKYIQHNLAVGDGLEGFGEVMKHAPEGGFKANVIRAFQDGEYVFTHTVYDFFGPKIGFDVFRFEDGLIVEHWDNLTPVVEVTASGRSQTDGPSDVEDLNQTKTNKTIVEQFVNDVLFGKAPQKITEYVSTDQYDQHNPLVKDGLDGLTEAIQYLTSQNNMFVYTKLHKVLGEGNFVLTISEGEWGGKTQSFYDLFRLKNGKIVEHWDVIEPVLPEAERKNKNGKFNF